MFRIYRLRDYNFLLVAFLAALSILGILLVNSADSSLTSRQTFGVVSGFCIMTAVSLADYKWILRFYRLIYAINIILLVLVLLFGITNLGAARWISIGGLQFQPTEPCKILLIMFFSYYFMKHEKDLSSWRIIIRAFILLGISLFMILRQPDLKNVITLAVVFVCMYYSAGLSYRKIGLILLIVIPAVFVLMFLIIRTDLPIINDYQKDRIMTFIDPENDDYDESAMQQENSVMAIGSGGLSGKGLNNNEVSSANKGNFVAEIQNDFIFAVAGEELGFAGCLLLIFLEGGIVFLCFRTGMRSGDLAGRLMCEGIGTLIAVQSFINICVATGLMPNTGTTLPFVSYGLSSLISLYFGMGMVLNVSLQREKDTEPGGKYVYEGEFFTAEETEAPAAGQTGSNSDNRGSGAGSYFSANRSA